VSIWAVGEVDPNTGFGTILHTADGGATPTSWTPQSSNTTQALFGLSFVNSEVGWAVGDNGVILHTVNGGTMWDVQTVGTAALYGVSCLNTQTCWAVGDVDPVSQAPVILHTVNGSTWTVQTNDAFDPLYAVTAVDGKRAWAVGGLVFDPGLILATTDGGTTWTFQNSGGTDPLNAVTFTSPSTGYAVGDRGTILKTTSGGY
jgi:photosystem II stability/assembly factor-like uncharacterized protein